MNETILVGRGPDVFEVPGEELETSLSQIPERFEERLRFMSEEHRRVRYFVARELPRVGVPIEPELIARGLNLPLQRASELLQELEHRLFFLVRNETGNVSWAFPVTVDRTPHYLAFSTGERLHGA